MSPITAPTFDEPFFSDGAATVPATAGPVPTESTRTDERDDGARDLADVPAAEVISAVAVHLMSAAAVKCGLTEEGDATLDLDEARKLITALAGLVTAARADLGVHAAPLRDGLQALQRAFREASPLPDERGEGPGEKLTGPV